MTQLHKDLKALGNSAVNKPLYEKEGVDKTVLERFPNPFKVSNPSGCSGTVTITAPEGTSRCPMTGQPDFFTLVIKYQPDEFCVESKALKLYIASFRDQPEFHEACVNRICNDLVELLNPVWIKVTGQFTPRGGIAFWPTAEWGQK
jgi:7-cyano-7-deazaguanine reductase